jgi:hypothetical protein
MKTNACLSYDPKKKPIRLENLANSEKEIVVQVPGTITSTRYLDI